MNHTPFPRSAIFTVIRSAAFSMSGMVDDSLDPDSIVDWRENASTDIALVDRGVSVGTAVPAIGMGVCAAASPTDRDSRWLGACCVSSEGPGPIRGPDELSETLLMASAAMSAESARACVVPSSLPAPASSSSLVMPNCQRSSMGLEP